MVMEAVLAMVPLLVVTDKLLMLDEPRLPLNGVVVSGSIADVKLEATPPDVDG
jgi:ABC-type branched-subunit amino acid transport system ATPase component